MPKVKTTPPIEPTREKGQKSLDLPNYLFRIMPQYRQPSWMKAELWRSFVRVQPIAVITRDTLISNILSLEWKIEPRDSNMRDELKDEITEFTRFIEHDGNYDYVERTERLLEDVLDTPFGGAMETIRVPDNQNGRVVDLIPIDAATLYPTLNKEWPVGQFIEQAPFDTVYFPAHSINRIFMSPRTEIMREGWGMPPPEKVYLTIEMLTRGDRYYADLLLDVPEAGILDLMDMEKEAAEEWVKSFRDLLAGTQSFKIPVLYEHTTKAEFIPFRLNPAEMVYDRIMVKYAGIVTAAYGMTLSDIGFPSASSGGETLAGSIRQERKTRRTGVARLKSKLKYWYDRILPPDLEFLFVDLDDEVAVAKGRARLANSTAFSALIDKRVFTPGEARQQMIADGLISISIPEEVPDESEFGDLIQQEKAPERPGLLGRPIAPSDGGHGEVLPRADVFTETLNKFFDIPDVKIKRLANIAIPDISVEVRRALSDYTDNSDIDFLWGEWFDEVVQDTFTDDFNFDIGDENPHERILNRVYQQMSDFAPTDLVPDNIDTISIAQDMVNLLKEIGTELNKIKAEYDYVNGKTDKFEFTEYEPDERILDDFIAEASKEADALFSKAKSLIFSAIVRGIRKTLTLPENQYNVATLDNQQLLSDNRIVKSIILASRENFKDVKSSLMQEYAEKIMEIIDKILEDK